MAFYHYPGDVSFTPQNRMKDHYQGLVAMAGLGIPALRAGTYRGAIGKQVDMSGLGDSTIQQRYGADLPVYALALRGAGLGITDREACAAVATMGAGLLQATGQFAQSQGGQPTTEQQRQQQAREQAAWTYAGQSAQTLANLCNLINQAETTAGSNPDPGNAAELARLRAEAQAAYLVAQRQMAQVQAGGAFPDWAKGALLIAGIAALGGGAYYLLRRKRK